MATAEIKRHWGRDVHGRELTALGLGRGMGQKTSDWLVIPLCNHHHVGDMGIDSSFGVESWQFYFGSQLKHLHTVSEKLGIDVIERARKLTAGA